MNFEELLETRDARQTMKVRLPYGYFYKRLIDGKYSNFVEFHDDLADYVTFANSVRTEAAEMEKITDRHQLHFSPNEGEDGVYAIAVEVGNFMTFGQLLNENPAIVAKKDFIHDTLRDLVEITRLINEHDVFHVCFSPDNVFARKSDSTVRLLLHGSYYQKLDQDVLYDGDEEFVAPEVLRSSQIDARSDVYSLAKFAQWLYQSSGVPIELKGVFDKATAEDPAHRYASVADFWQVLQVRHSFRKTALMAIGALAIALVVVGGYFYLLPSPDDIEYVKPVEEPIPDDMLDEDGDLLFGIGADADSAAIAEAVSKQAKINDSVSVDDRKLREYQAKAEAIFRKQFSRAADQILSRVYNNEKMNMSEKEFMVRSKAMTEELAKKEQELAKQADLGNERSQRIASEIIDQLTTKKMKELDKDYMGIRKKAEADEPAKKTNTTDKK